MKTRGLTPKCSYPKKNLVNRRYKKNTKIFLCHHYSCYCVKNKRLTPKLFINDLKLILKSSYPEKSRKLVIQIRRFSSLQNKFKKIKKLMY